MQTFAPERDIVSWDDLDRLVEGLADRLSGERFDLMLAITRGGLVPAGMLAYRLRIRNILVAAVEFYDDAGKPGPHPTFLQFPADPLLRGQRILVVDEVWDSGTTIHAVTERIRQAGGEPTTAVLHYKPSRSPACATAHHGSCATARRSSARPSPWPFPKSGDGCATLCAKSMACARRTSRGATCSAPFATMRRVSRRGRGRSGRRHGGRGSRSWAARVSGGCSGRAGRGARDGSRRSLGRCRAPAQRDLGARVVLVMAAEPDAEARALHDEVRRRAGITVLSVGATPLDALPLLRHLRQGGVAAFQLDRPSPSTSLRTPVRPTVRGPGGSVQDRWSRAGADRSAVCGPTRLLLVLDRAWGTARVLGAEPPRPSSWRSRNAPSSAWNASLRPIRRSGFTSGKANLHLNGGRQAPSGASSRADDDARLHFGLPSLKGGLSGYVKSFDVLELRCDPAPASPEVPRTAPTRSAGGVQLRVELRRSCPSSRVRLRPTSSRQHERRGRLSARAGCSCARPRARGRARAPARGSRGSSRS